MPQMKRRVMTITGLATGLTSATNYGDRNVNQQMADKLGHYQREVSTLNKKVDQLTADKKSLQLLCAEQQDTINRKNDQLRRIMEIGRK